MIRLFRLSKENGLFGLNLNNENYTREMVVNNTLYVMENDEFGCKLEMNKKFKTIGY